MQTIPNYVRVLLVCGLLQATVSALFAVEAAARVTRVKGTGRFSLDGQNWQPLQSGDLVRSGTILRSGSGPGSAIDLVLYDTSVGVPQPVGYRPFIPTSMNTYVGPAGVARNVVALADNTTLKLDRLSLEQTGVETVTDTEMTLSEGKIFGAVQNMPAASKYEVKLPKGAVAIRDAQYAISADGTVSETRGSVQVSYPDATGAVHTETVAAGQTFNPANLAVVPIGAGEREAILAALAGAGGGAGALFISVATDQTIENTLSPVVGANAVVGPTIPVGPGPGAQPAGPIGPR